MGSVPHQLLTVLNAHPNRGRYWIALSGGVDSTVLLHLLSQISLSQELHAVHIHHGLQAEADAWAEQCQQLCDRLQVPLTVRSVDAKPAVGESPEAAARQARYSAFESLLQPEDQLLTAHHQEDQAETFLLRALRGSGVCGLAAMRTIRPLRVGMLLRPLLGVPKQQLIDYAEAEQLSWVEDPTNQELDADRNFLRNQIFPQLRERWPAVASTLSRSASHCAESDGLLQHVGKEQLSQLQPGEPLPLLEGESVASCKNRIRCWLELNRTDSPDSVHMARILDELIGAREDATPLVEWSAIDGQRVQLRRFQQALYLVNAVEQPLFEAPQLWDLQQSLPLTENILLQSKNSVGVGLSVSALKGRQITVCWRQGGERCQPAGTTKRRTLKNILRERRVPPWEREQIPLLFVGEEIAMVVGHFVCEPFVAKVAEPSVEVVIVEKST